METGRQIVFISLLMVSAVISLSLSLYAFNSCTTLLWEVSTIYWWFWCYFSECWHGNYVPIPTFVLCPSHKLSAWNCIFYWSMYDPYTHLSTRLKGHQSFKSQHTYTLVFVDSLAKMEKISTPSCLMHLDCEGYCRSTRILCTHPGIFNFFFGSLLLMNVG